MDSKHGINVARISSAQRSHASTVKVDAPSATERAFELAGPGVDSPAALSSTKTIEKRWPPDADRSHQSATLLVFHGGGAGRAAQIHAKMGAGPVRYRLVVHRGRSVWLFEVCVARCKDMSQLVSIFRWREGTQDCDGGCQSIHWSARL